MFELVGAWTARASFAGTVGRDGDARLAGGGLWTGWEPRPVKSWEGSRCYAAKRIAQAEVIATQACEDGFCAAYQVVATNLRNVTAGVTIRIHQSFDRWRDP